MTLGQAAAYGVVQGLAEFLPISSSAHLNLMPWLLGWKDPGLAFDVALHLGTLLALVGYFWKDWLDILRGSAADPRGAQARLLGLLVLGTVPGAVAGLVLGHLAEETFRWPPLTAGALILFALWMGWAERNGKKSEPLSKVDLRRALLVGLSQALAIVPGVSRSGITITAGLLEDLTPEAAARFSFLLSAPITAGAALHELHKMRLGVDAAAFYVAVAVSAVVGLVAIRFLLRCLARGGLMPFVVYRVALGAAILGLYAWRR
ncbi:MAG TPA: undecaprenyl-diphosphate phosphatase [Elusimicrobiota bacterium]|jgi:undecaprenyl-diphosphatase|nr:undecaprenyl-diphosphate phosphatase [Elusimicrobiota bacterium]